MTRIAHLTDLHLVEPDYLRRGAGDRARLHYLNTGRRIDVERRRQHAIDARPADAERIDDLAESCDALIVVQHHPPLGLRNPLMNWIDGLCDPRASTALLQAHEHLQVLHGHVHYAASRAVVPERIDQVHCAAAMLESALHVRFYELIDGRLFPLDRPHAADGAQARVPRTACAEVGAVSI